MWHMSCTWRTEENRVASKVLDLNWKDPHRPREPMLQKTPVIDRNGQVDLVSVRDKVYIYIHVLCFMSKLECSKPKPARKKTKSSLKRSDILTPRMSTNLPPIAETYHHHT